MNADISEFSAWFSETEPDVIKSHLHDLLMLTDFSIVGFAEHYFEPQGYTATWLLAESHLAVHTFPEAAKSYVQLSSCNGAKYELFCRLLGEFLHLV